MSLNSDNLKLCEVWQLYMHTPQSRFTDQICGQYIIVTVSVGII